jgi:hypothetical protein
MLRDFIGAVFELDILMLVERAVVVPPRLKQLVALHTFAEALEGVADCGIQEMRQGGRAGAAHVGVAFQACFGGRAGLAS